MEQNRRLSILYNPVFRVTSTLLWVLVGPLFVGVIIFYILKLNITLRNTTLHLIISYYTIISIKEEL